MPGAYAHLTLVNIASETDRLETANVPIPAIVALMNNLRFCELGAVSPDYPYLHLGMNGSKQWADLMHYERTGEPIKKGIELARHLNLSDKGPVAAWLMGYAAHVVADVTIHPVVERRVGKYEENSRQHRICEMNQDAYIYRRLNLDDVGRSEHLNSGIWRCCDGPDSGRLDRSVHSVWESMLSHCYPDEFANNRPEIHSWHAGFNFSVNMAGEATRMPLFARHVAVDCGITYPAVPDIDYTFIHNLETPDGFMNYDELFEKAIHNVVEMWAVIGKAIYEDDQSYRTRIGNWNLDTGKDAQDKFAYWLNTEVQHA